MNPTPPRELGVLESARLVWVLGRKSVDPPQWFLGVLAACFSVVLWVVEPWIGKALIDIGLRERESDAFAVLLGTGGVLAAIAYGFDLSSRWLLGECERRTFARLHLRWSGVELESQSLLQAEKTTADPERMSLASSVGFVAELVCSLPARSMAAFLQLLLIAGVLSHFRPWLGPVVLGAWFVVFYATFLVSQRFADSRAEAETYRGRREATARRLWLLRDWLKFGRRSDQGVRSLAASWERWRAVDAQRESWEAALSSVQWGGMFLLSFSLAVFCGFRVIHGELSLGEYVAIQVYLGLARGPVDRLTSGWKTLAAARRELRGLPGNVHLQQFVQALSDEERVVDRDPSVLSDSGIQSLAFARSLRLQSTRFWDGELELDGVMIGGWGPYSLRIARGSRVLALPPAGLTAEQRTVFFQQLRELLSGSRAPEKGVIRVGGRDLREMPQSWLRRWSATVHREPVLFSGTLRELLLSDFLPARRPSEVNDLIERVGFTDRDLDRWISVDEISHAEAQRIGLARALLQKPALTLIEENLPLWVSAHASRLSALVQAEVRTVVACGESGALLSLVDAVWQPQVDPSHRVSGQFAQPLDLERFLLEGNLESFREAGSLLSQALESRSLQNQWTSIQKRFGLESLAFEVQLQGPGEVLLEVFPRILDACREAFRDADLAAQSGFRTFRLICLGAKASARPILFHRLFAVLAQAVRESSQEGREGVSFRIRDLPGPVVAGDRSVRLALIAGEEQTSQDEVG